MNAPGAVSSLDLRERRLSYFVGWLAIVAAVGHACILATTIAEVLAHAAVATVLLGWDSAFHLYILCPIPLIYYVVRRPLRVRGGASVLVLLAYLALAVVADRLEIRFPQEHAVLLPVARYGNIAHPSRSYRCPIR